MSQSYRIALPHQRELLGSTSGVQELALFWEMRLGKCLAVLRWLEREQQRSILIVCPATLIPVWERECQLEGLAVRNLRTAPLLNEVLGSQISQCVCLINYELLRVRPQWLAYNWNAIVLDESATIRNPKAKISKLLCAVTRHIPYRACLSGEPMPESLLDIFQQFKFLFGHFMGCSNYWQWRDKTHLRGYTGYDWVPKPGGANNIVGIVKQYSHTLTRRQADVGGGIVFQTRYVDLPASSKSAYLKAIKSFSWGSKSTKWRVVVDSWLAQISGGEHKDAELLNLLQGELSKQPVVVWFRFNTELCRIHEKLEAAGISSACIAGSGKYKSYPLDRQLILDRFDRGKVRVLLVQLKCGKYGLDMSRADTAIYFSCTYEAETRTQSIPRIIHPRKRHAVLVVDLVTKDTIDEDIREALMVKGATSKGIFVRSLKKALERIK